MVNLTRKISKRKWGRISDSIWEKVKHPSWWHAISSVKWPIDKQVRIDQRRQLQAYIKEL